MNPQRSVRDQIIDRLHQVIDPETNQDVISMRLVEELEVDDLGNVSYTVRPSSSLCPIAVFLALQIKGAVASVPGVNQQAIRIKGYIAADELTALINQN